jgi:excisionase family DNA binding protein
MALSLGQAAKLTGLGKTTITRAIKSGRLSATRLDGGSYQIDPAELSRVYPFPAPAEATGATVAATGPAVGDATPATPPPDAEIAGLREVAALLREQLVDVKQDRDAWRSQAEANQRLLASAKPRGGVFSRLFGKTA